MTFKEYIEGPADSDIASFEPPFCPHPRCSLRYQRPPKEYKWCRKIGIFYRKNGDSVMRWRCMQDDKPHSFSYSSFQVTYWLRNRNLLSSIAQLETEQSSMRGLARSLSVSQSCIYGQLMRLGRHFLLLHQLSLNSIDAEQLGAMIMDELESWEVSQFTPTSHALFMDACSGYKLHLHSVPINRKGKMTPEQKLEYAKWVKKHGKLPKSNAHKQMQEILRILKSVYQKQSGKVQVVSDEKKSYPIALKKQWSDVNYIHLQYSGKINRNIGYMGKINAEDLYIRQRSSTMRRESLDFMRRHNNTNLRHAIYLVKRNLVMPAAGTNRLENPGTRIGLIKKPMPWTRLIHWNLAHTLSRLPEYLRKTYGQLSRTVYYGNNHTLKTVFVC